MRVVVEEKKKENEEEDEDTREHKSLQFELCKLPIGDPSILSLAYLPNTDDSIGDENEQNDERFNKCSDCIFILFEEG